MNLTFRHTKLACYFSYIGGAVVNNFTPLLFIIFQRQFGLTMAQLSFLILLNFGVQMTVDFFGARYVDSIGYRTCIVSANLFAAAGLAMLGILPLVMSPFSGLILSVIFYAIGSGMLEVMVSPMVAALPMDGKAASMSFLHSFYCWGVVITVLVTTAFFSLFGQENWPMICYIWAILPAITALVFTHVPINPFTDEENNVPMRRLFGMKIFWLFLVLMLCSGAAELAMAQWASLFCETALGVSKTVGDLFGVCMFSVLMGISRVLYGKFSERVNLENYILLSALLCVLSYLLASLTKVGAFALFGCALCGFSVGVTWPGVLSMAAKRCPQGGTALFGLLAMAGDIGCFTGPGLAALVSERFMVNGSGLKAGLFACIVFPIVIIIGILLLKNKERRKRT